MTEDLQPSLSLTLTGTRTVDATATATNPYGWSILECDFAYGDGTTSVQPYVGNTGCSGTHTYASDGTYPVSVTVTDAGGEVATKTTDLVVSG